jgi:probable phosphoglycerate mutase
VTTFLLVRHGLHLFGGERIAGRLPGVHLSPAGQEEVAGLVARLAGVPIDAVLSSPMERTMETAAALAEARGRRVEPCDDLLEIDFGEWTGAAIDDLGPDERWTRWNRYRSGHRAPGGESMLEVQHRALGLLQRLVLERPDGCVALVTHADVIKAVLAQLLGAPLDLFLRIEISPASVSVVHIGEHGPWVLAVNHVGRLATLPVFGEG